MRLALLDRRDPGDAQQLRIPRLNHAQVPADHPRPHGMPGDEYALPPNLEHLKFHRQEQTVRLNNILRSAMAMCNRYVSPEAGDIERQWPAAPWQDLADDAVFPRSQGPFI